MTPSSRSECQEPYTDHSYQEHSSFSGLWVCAHCGDDRECSCAMTEASMMSCEVHGVEGIEL